MGTILGGAWQRCHPHMYMRKVHCLLFHLIVVLYADTSTVVPRMMAVNKLLPQESISKCVRWKINNRALLDLWHKYRVEEGVRVNPYDG